MRLVIVSDLHAISAPPVDGLPPTYVSFANTNRTAASDPLIGLRTLFDTGRIQPPDLLICAGDLADKADSQAISRVWGELIGLTTAHKIGHFFATCGNHDIDTRHQQNKFDPRGYLRALEPPFPAPGHAKNSIPHLEYWANNFSIFEDSNWRLLNINTCAYHGFGSSAEPELNHGRISEYTLDDIERQLKALVLGAPHKKNICLFHHHIRAVSSDSFDDNSMMKGANRLIDLLSKPQLGDWLVIHGHRHRSSLYYAGGNSSPIVLSCASFSATRKGDENNPCPNQFYEIELEPELVTGFSKVRGTLNAWNWTPGTGWQRNASIPGGLPVAAGFGFRGDLHSFAGRIRDAVRNSGRVTWEMALETFSDLRHVIPTDLEHLTEVLAANSDIVLSMEGTRIREIVRAGD